MTAAEASGRPQKPLDGVRILAVEQMQALPFATQLLAHLGAEVVKVEHPQHGDSGRAALPAVTDRDGRKVGATYLRNNLGKHSIAVDLKDARGRDLVRRLAGRFDVLGENFKPGTMERLGLGYAELSALHPRLVYVSVSGFGNLSETPYSAWPAYAPIAEAMGGFYEYKRKEDEPPLVGPAGALGDIGTSLFAAIGILAALRQRDRTGRGRHVDVAMFDAMVAMADVVPFMWSMGVRGKRRAAGIFAGFRARDGYFVVQVVREHQFRLLAEAIGRPEWVGEERFARREQWADQLEGVIRPAVEQWAAAHTKLEAATLLCAQGLAAGPCNSAEDIRSDPHVRAHNMLIEVPRPDGGEPLLVVGNPIKMSDVADEPASHWPTLGEHTDEVLRAELGIADGELRSLRDDGVIG